MHFSTMAFVAPSPLSLRSGIAGVNFGARIRPRVRTMTTCAADGAVVGTAAAFAAAAAVIAASVFSPAAADASTFHFSGERPSNLGVRKERYLAASCPPTPNCIGSMENVYDKHYVPSWTYGTPEGSKDSRPKKTLDEAVHDLQTVISNYNGATIIKQRETKNEFGDGYYIYSEFESPTFGFGTLCDYNLRCVESWSVPRRASSIRLMSFMIHC
jgi:uncharacterized protein (DUF1499 family)